MDKSLDTTVLRRQLPIRYLRGTCFLPVRALPRSCSSLAPSPDAVPSPLVPFPADACLAAG